VQVLQQRRQEGKDKELAQATRRKSRQGLRVHQVRPQAPQVRQGHPLLHLGTAQRRKVMEAALQRPRRSDMLGERGHKTKMQRAKKSFTEGSLRLAEAASQRKAMMNLTSTPSHQIWGAM